MCVEACPEDAIRMVKETPDLPGFDRDRMWLRQDELLNWQPKQDVAKPYPAAGAGRTRARHEPRDPAAVLLRAASLAGGVLMLIARHPMRVALH